jgi:hypothetical protein
MSAITDADKPSSSHRITRAAFQQANTLASAIGISHDIQTTTQTSFHPFPARDDAESLAIRTTSSVLDEAEQLFERLSNNRV